MIRAKAIDHVCLWVKSAAETKDYFSRLFGFDCRPREGDGRSFIMETCHVHFFLNEEEGDCGYISKQHLSFEVESIDQVISSLNEFGVTDYTCGEVTLFQQRNYKWCEWRDPNGIRLECVEII